MKYSDKIGTGIVITVAVLVIIKIALLIWVAITTEPVIEKSAKAEVINEKVVVATKLAVDSIPLAPVLKQAKAIKGSKQIRNVSVKQTTKGGDVVTTDVGIFKANDGQTRATVVTDNGVLTEVTDLVLETGDPMVDRKGRIFGELRTETGRELQVAIGIERRLTDSLYAGVDIVHPVVGLGVGETYVNGKIGWHKRMAKHIYTNMEVTTTITGNNAGHTLAKGNLGIEF